MTVLKDTRNVKEIVLPISKAKVSIYNTLLAGEIEQVYEMKESEMKKVRKMLSFVIKSWDFTDENGNELPITDENLAKLQMPDITAMIEETDFTEKKKK